MSILRRALASVADKPAPPPQPRRRPRKPLVVGDLGARLDELPGPYGPDPIVFGPGPGGGHVTVQKDPTRRQD